MTTKISGNQINNFTIETTQLSNTAVAAFAQSLAPKVLYANVANSAFTVLDDTAVNVGGGYTVLHIVLNQLGSLQVLYPIKSQIQPLMSLLVLQELHHML